MARYWPEPEALMLEHYGLRYSPDLVIVGVLPNDFVDTRVGPQAEETPTRLQQLCATRECAAIDTLPTIRTHPDPDSLYYPINGHCTEAGYALIADVVVRELDARGMLPETLRPADQPVAASISPGNR